MTATLSSPIGNASCTRYEWILADLAIMCAGGATTTVYPTTNSSDTSYILGDSECRVAFAEELIALADECGVAPCQYDPNASGDACPTNSAPRSPKTSPQSLQR